MNKKIHTEAVDRLFEAILCLKNKEECYTFFEDICTMKELETIAQRLVGAKMLINNNTFNEIVSATGASTTTISRVNRCLQYGAGGYELVLGQK